jgi:hypothetical protein
MSEKKLNKRTAEPEKLEPKSTGIVTHTGEKTFIEPELKEYPSLTEVTLLTVPGVSGATFFKTFK